MFDPFHFNIQVSCAWSSDTAREYFETHIRTAAQVQDAEANGKGEASGEKPGTLAFQLAAAALLSSKFIVSRLADSQLQLYQVHDWQAHEVAAVTGKADDVNVVIARAVVDTLEQDGVAVTGEKLALMRMAFLSKARLQPQPQLLGQPDDDDWCVYRARIRPEAAVGFPLIQQFYG